MEKPLVAVIAVSIFMVAFGSFFIFYAQNTMDESEILITETKFDEEIRIGTVNNDPTKMVKRFSPVVNYISDRLSDDQTTYAGRVLITSTVDEMIDLLNNQEIDFYFESPFTGIYVAEKSNSKPILIRWKENSLSYNSVFFVQQDSVIQNISDLKGKTIIFEGEESTSGFRLPLAHLIQNNYTINNNPNLSYHFSGDDENTPLWVLEQKGDVGVASNLDFEDYPIEIQNQLRIIDETMDVPRQIVLHRSNMESDLVEKISTLLINMDEDPQGLEILDNFKHTTQFTLIENPNELVLEINQMLNLIEKELEK